MTTTAEGVETAEEAELIRNLGCDKIQGYLFRAPDGERGCPPAVHPIGAAQRLRRVFQAVASAERMLANSRRPSAPPKRGYGRGFDRTFRVRHHAQHPAIRAQHPGNIARRTIAGFAIAERDPAFALDPVQRLVIGKIIAVVMGHRNAQAFARRESAGEQRGGVLDL